MSENTAKLTDPIWDSRNSDEPLVVPCCDYVVREGQTYPVYWNPYNKVVQCHNCGHVWVPQPAKIVNAMNT